MMDTLLAKMHRAMAIQFQIAKAGACYISSSSHKMYCSLQLIKQLRRIAYVLPRLIKKRTNRSSWQGYGCTVIGEMPFVVASVQAAAGGLSLSDEAVCNVISLAWMRG